MKCKLALLLTAALFPLLSFGQGCITIFSEDGDRFYLVLNAVKQNPTPQTNVRVDGLTADYYNAKIIFEDASKGEISKNLPVKDAGTGQFAEVTYKIKKTKDGDLKIRYFSATPVPVTYTPPPDVYYVHFGQPAPVSNTVTQTTVTTTTANPANTGSGGISIGVNAGGAGLNMNVNVNDPNANTTVTQTSTTTTRTTSSSTTTEMGMGFDGGGTQPAAAAGCQYPMDWNSFKSAKETVSNASFEETKLSTAKTICSANCLSTDQIVQICKLFGFEASKLDFAKFAYGKTTDRGNYFKVGNVFDYDASRTELNNYISGNAR